MDVRRIIAAAGTLAAVGAVLLLGVPLPAIAAGGFGAVVARGADRGTAGTAAASLALLAAILLAAFGAPSATTAAGTLAALVAAIGLAGCLAAAVGDGQRGSVGALAGAWAALCLLPVGWFAVSVASAQPAGSLLGARLTWLGPGFVALVVPGILAAGAGAVAVGGWRDADLPPLLLTIVPAGALAGGAAMLAPDGSNIGTLLAGIVATAPLAYALLWAATTALLATALAATVAATDHRYRRPPMWAAVATGPTVLAAVVAFDGGVLVRLILAGVPPASGAVGAIAETAPPATARSFVAAATLAGLALALVVPIRAPVLGHVVAGRPAGVGAGCLLVAVALAGESALVTALAGSLAVLAWVLLAPTEGIEPPPRTELARVGVTASAVGIGAVAVVALSGRVSEADPGLGGALLLSGVVALGLAMR